MADGNYYIGGGDVRQARPRTRRERRRRLSITLISVSIALILLFNIQLYPQITALAESAVSNRITEIISTAIGALLSEEGEEYRDLITLSYAEGGRVAALTEDTLRMQRLRYRMAQAILHALKSEAVTVSVPLGNLFGILALSGRGGTLPVSVRTAESLLASYHTSFSECGINQTLYTVDLCMEITVYYLLPVRSRKMTVSGTFRAAEAVIVGEVPDNLTQINRYTNETEEIEIDDAVDFGGILG